MVIEKLKRIYDGLLKSINLDFKRYFFYDLEKYDKIAIVGERGIGKTYTVLQYLKLNSEKSFYLSADNPLITDLFEIVSELVLDYGVELLAIDEIHKFYNREIHLKSIIDSFPNIKLIVLGSSSLNIYKGTGALSRRIYNLKVFPLSFREFMNFKYKVKLPKLSFLNIIKNYKDISFQLASNVKKSYIDEFMKIGFYPFFNTDYEIFISLLMNNVKKIITEDLLTFINMKSFNILKLEKFFYFVANTAPSDLNILSLSRKIGISKDLLEDIVFYLEKIGVINLAIRTNKLSDIIRKEFKIFLGNPNLYYVFSQNINIGAIRECFILHFLKRVGKVDNISFSQDIILPRYGDFLFKFNGKFYNFEVGGKNKTNSKAKNIDNGFVIKDDILIAQDNEIPIYLFGLLE